MTATTGRHSRSTRSTRCTVGAGSSPPAGRCGRGRQLPRKGAASPLSCHPRTFPAPSSAAQCRSAAAAASASDLVCAASPSTARHPSFCSSMQSCACATCRRTRSCPHFGRREVIIPGRGSNCVSHRLSSMTSRWRRPPSTCMRVTGSGACAEMATASPQGSQAPAPGMPCLPSRSTAAPPRRPPRPQHLRQPFRHRQPPRPQNLHGRAGQVKPSLRPPWSPSRPLRSLLHAVPMRPWWPWWAALLLPLPWLWPPTAR
mmetsp:Transcript_93136/g.278057  ORF Transcript_93136/g.278057 Transcript_93136/m.278057 type:complete len:258 (-) Transcript_93136:797-1570(-)